MNQDNNNEIWRDCPEFEEHYQISNFGNLKSKAVFIPHSGNWNKDTGGYIKNIKYHNAQKNRYGYIHVKLCKYGKCRHRLVHRLVGLAFIPNPNKYKQIDHVDGNKENNIVTNLNWVSPAENIRRAYATGLMNSDHLKGEKHFKAKLTQNDVNVIKELFLTHKIKEIATLYNVSISTINDIKYKRTWVV